MTELNGRPGELSFTLQITRAETGRVEEYQVTGTLDPEQLKPFETEQKEQDHGCHPQ